MNRRLRRASNYVIWICVFLLFGILLAAAVNGDDDRPDRGPCNCFSGGKVLSIHAGRLPVYVNPPEHRVYVHGHLYSLSINPETKVADWVCYRATAADGASRNAIERRWINGLPDILLEHQDYPGPEYDMGHLAPLATFSSSVYAYELNFLANVAPQRPGLNRGPWVQMEKRVRDLCAGVPYVDVCVGPLYERPMPPLPNADEPHRVPSHFWAVIRPRDSPAVAYVMPQTCERTAPLSTFRVSVAEVERRSGLDLGGGDG